MNRGENFNQILDDFYHYLSNVIRLYEGILPVIKAELDAIIKKDIASLDENLKEQQVLLLQTKNFDKEIVEYTRLLKVEADNLSSLIQKLPDDQQLRFFALLSNFSEAVSQISFYKDRCKVLLQSHLHSIDIALAKQAGTVENKTYRPNASIGKNISASFETTI